MRTRFCRECGETFEAVDDNDWLCKKCLLAGFRALSLDIRKISRKEEGTEPMKNPLKEETIPIGVSKILLAHLTPESKEPA